jgi:hypothetical protein
MITNRPEPSVCLPLEHQVALIPGAWLTAEVSWICRANRNEPGLGQRSLGRDILAGGGRPQCAQPVSHRRHAAQLPDSGGRHAVPSSKSYRLNTAQNRATFGDEHVEGADARILLSQ